MNPTTTPPTSPPTFVIPIKLYIAMRPGFPASSPYPSLPWSQDSYYPFALTYDEKYLSFGVKPLFLSSLNDAFLPRHSGNALTPLRRHSLINILKHRSNCLQEHYTSTECRNML